MVEHAAVAHAIAGAGAIQEIGRVAHALHAAGDDDIGRTGADEIVATIAAFMPEPHILLTVVQPAASGRPAPSDACRAGAWP